MIISKQENLFWQNYGILDLDNFQVKLQYWVASLCNQLHPEFSSNQFETLHRCYKHIEDVHVTLAGKKIILTKLQHLGLRRFSGQVSVSPLRVLKHSFWNFAQLVKACWRCACVFCTQKYNFDKITVILTLTVQTLVFSIDWMCWGSWMRMGQEVRTNLGHRGITCVLQTQFSSLDWSRASAYCTCSSCRWGSFWHFSLVYHFYFCSPSLWETARYRLKYCLKVPLSPKQPTN